MGKDAVDPVDARVETVQVREESWSLNLGFVMMTGRTVTQFGSQVGQIVSDSKSGIHGTETGSAGTKTPSILLRDRSPFGAAKARPSAFALRGSADNPDTLLRSRVEASGPR